MLQLARGRAKTAISALGDEFICPEQVLGPVATLPLDCYDVNMETDSYWVTSRSIVSHRILRGFSRTVSVQYLTSWNELEKTPWETEQDLEQYGNVVERYWAGEPKQVGREDAKYRAYRVQMAKRLQARPADKVYVPLGHKLSCDPRFSLDMCSPDPSRQLAMGGICKDGGTREYMSTGGAFW